MKIYLIGIVGTGKTTIARELSEQFDIFHYELDSIVMEKNENGKDRKREKDEILSLFHEIIQKENWLIEDVGREVFQEAYDLADKIIYLNISEKTIKRRILLRWIKQKLRIEKSSYIPTIKSLRTMYMWYEKGQLFENFE